MKIRQTIIGAVMALGVLLGAEALAIPISTLYSTGVDNTGNPLSTWSVDQHYALSFGTTSYQARAVPTAGLWIANSSESAWIGPTANGNYTTYTYTTRFDLTGYDKSSASISGWWATDNGGTAILLNGTSLGITNLSTFPFTSKHFFSILSGPLLSGENTLAFVVYNDTGATGLRVELSGEAEPSAVPEPSTLMLLAGGLTAACFIRKRNGKV